MSMARIMENYQRKLLILACNKVFFFLLACFLQRRLRNRIKEKEEAHEMKKKKNKIKAANAFGCGS